MNNQTLNDLSLIFCTNEPAYVDGVPIYPIPIKKIAELGYKRFRSGMSLLCMTADDVNEIASNDISKYGVFMYLVCTAIKAPEMMETLIFWLSQLTHSQITFSRSELCFTNGDFKINKNNFEDIQTIIRIRNGFQDINAEEENPDNEAARRVLQRRKEERIKRNRVNQEDNESDITLADLVSILASGQGMLMDTVMEYDLYQFNDQFNRLRIMDDYNDRVKALLHGAKREDVNLTHWITKIKNNTD